jgi:hypothetical protein
MIDITIKPVRAFGGASVIKQIKPKETISAVILQYLTSVTAICAWNAHIIQSNFSVWAFLDTFKIIQIQS